MKLKIEGVELNVGPEYEISMIRIDHVQGYATVFVLYEDGEEDVFQIYQVTTSIHGVRLMLEIVFNAC